MKQRIHKWFESYYSFSWNLIKKSITSPIDRSNQLFFFNFFGIGISQWFTSKNVDNHKCFLTLLHKFVHFAPPLSANSNPNRATIQRIQFSNNLQVVSVSIRSNDKHSPSYNQILAPEAGCNSAESAVPPVKFASGACKFTEISPNVATELRASWLEPPCARVFRRNSSNLPINTDKRCPMNSTASLFDVNLRFN